MLFGLLKRKKYPATERRREARYFAEDEFVLEFKANTSHYIGTSRDVSIHGVRFATTCKLKAGNKIVLNFRFPEEFRGEKHITVDATVVRVYKPRGVERFRVACSLKHSSESTKEVLRQFVYWLENKGK